MVDWFRKAFGATIGYMTASLLYVVIVVVLGGACCLCLLAAIAFSMESG